MCLFIRLCTWQWFENMFGYIEFWKIQFTSLKLHYFFIQDINECELGLSGCSNECTNTIGSFYCSCPSGSQLDKNAKACISKCFLRS